jgi:hypothetical protein
MLLKRRFPATAAALLPVITMLACLLVSGASAEERVDVYTIPSVPVDATAANANAARDAARIDGERRAYQLLLGRLTLEADRARRPKVSNAALQDLVQGFEVAKERTSGVRYLAEYTFHFRADAVRRLLRQAGIAFAETPSKPLVVLPVMVAGEGAVLWDEPNPWRDAWGSSKPVPGLVRLVLPLGELADVAAIDADGATRGDDAKLQAIAQRYGNGDVLVSRAVRRDDAKRPGFDISTTRFAPGMPGGEQSWTASVVANPGESDADLMARGVTSVVAQVEEAWKVANILNYSQSGTIVATVPARDLAAWIAVRDRLAGIPAIQRSELLSLDHQGARLAIHYVGDPAQLRLGLSQRDLELSGGEPDWVLRQRTGAAQR